MDHAQHKIMTVSELIKQLQDIVDEYPNSENVEIFVYPGEDTIFEEPNEIVELDNSFDGDRIDINIGMNYG